MGAYIRLLRNRNFATLWTGSTISSFGDALTWVALIWLTLTRTGSPRAVSVLVIVYTAPVLVGGFVMGAALDRVDRRRFLIAVNAVLGVAVASVPMASALGDLYLGQLYAVAGLYGLLKMANWAGVPSIVPTLVAEQDLNTANAMESVSFGVADVGGPAVAGLLIASVGAATVLAVDAGSYLLFIGFLLRLTVPSHRSQLPASDGARNGVRGLGLRPALRFMTHNRPVLATTLMFMAFNVGEGVILVLVPVYARQQLAGGPRTFGLLLSAFAAAALVGSTFVGALAWKAPLLPSIAATQTMAGGCYLGLLITPNLAISLASFILAGLFTSPMTIWAQTLRMGLIPADMRGRLFGLLRTLMQSTPPLGAAIGGVLLNGGRTAATVILAASVMAIPGLIGLLSSTLAPSAHEPHAIKT